MFRKDEAAYRGTQSRGTDRACGVPEVSAPARHTLSAPRRLNGNAHLCACSWGCSRRSPAARTSPYEAAFHGTITNDNHAALWHGRFLEGPDAAAVEFETSIHVDERMALDDIAGSMAHANMLARQKIISSEDNKAIQEGLESIRKDLLSGELKIDYSAEDIHSL